MSTLTWNLNRGKCSKLNSFDKDIIAASGTPLTIKGQTTIDLRINEKTYPITTVVADIDGDIILGLDLFKRYQCHIDLESEKIRINGDNCILTGQGTSGCYRVVVSEKVQIPARTEIIVPAEVSGTDKIKENLCIIEPTLK
ncbi:hypothetical protein DPMN_113544 [Dreissena polymorpha]|uniref:Uncharacterized protein n=1 Tax=Dreissena polymorpha TaxID=45954 RepID=A0A9D4KJ89_DREPO|nr:hypothetical protein DPMN_113544 [Dreissena polymorpha]